MQCMFCVEKRRAGERAAHRAHDLSRSADRSGHRRPGDRRQRPPGSRIFLMKLLRKEVKVGRFEFVPDERRGEAMGPEAQAPKSWFETRPRHLPRKHYNGRMKEMRRNMFVWDNATLTYPKCARVASDRLLVGPTDSPASDGAPADAQAAGSPSTAADAGILVVVSAARFGLASMESKTKSVCAWAWVTAIQAWNVAVQAWNGWSASCFKLRSSRPLLEFRQLYEARSRALARGDTMPSQNCRIVLIPQFWSKIVNILNVLCRKLTAILCRKMVG